MVTSQMEVGGLKGAFQLYTRLRFADRSRRSLTTLVRRD
jgi:hypothetical protein